MKMKSKKKKKKLEAIQNNLSIHLRSAIVNLLPGMGKESLEYAQNAA